MGRHPQWREEWIGGAGRNREPWTASAAPGFSAIVCFPGWFWMKLFVDDCHSHDDKVILDRDLAWLQKWSERSDMSLYPSSETYCRSTLATPPTSISYVVRSYKRCQDAKYLSIIISDVARRANSGCLLAVDCIVYSDIFNTFNSPYIHSTLSIAIIETPECQHCIVWQWAAFYTRERKTPNY